MEGRPEQGHILPRFGVKLHETPGKEEMKAYWKQWKGSMKGVENMGKTRSGVVGKYNVSSCATLLERAEGPMRQTR
jgi:hypothetical protein